MFKFSLDELMAALCAQFHRRQNTNTGGEGGRCTALHLPQTGVSLRWEPKAGWDLGHHHQLGQLCASGLGHGPTQDMLHPSPGVVSWCNKRGKPFGPLRAPLTSIAGFGLFFLPTWCCFTWPSEGVPSAFTAGFPSEVQLF